MKAIILALIMIIAVKTVSASSGGVSRVGIEAIKKHESLRLRVYNDAGGRPTIGYGHLIKRGEDFSRGISKQEADSMLRKDVSKAANTVRSTVNVPLSQKQFDALASLTFNIGSGAFSRSTLVKVLNRGDYQEAAIQIRRWNKVNGEPNKGLSNRRMDETIMFIKGTK